MITAYPRRLLIEHIPLFSFVMRDGALYILEGRNEEQKHVILRRIAFTTFNNFFGNFFSSIKDCNPVLPDVIPYGKTTYMSNGLFIINHDVAIV